MEVLVKEKADEKTDIMTAKEVAEHLRMSYKNVLTQAEEGQIPGKKIGSLWRFSRKTIEQFV